MTNQKTFQHRVLFLVFCRITLAVIGLSWLIIGTILVGFLPESRYGWARASGLSLYSRWIFFFTVTCRFFLMKPYIFSGFLPVWRAGWASWCTWPATGSVLEACQPPSTITTGQFKPSVCTWSQDSLTKARSVCPTEKTNPEKEEYVSPITPRPSTLWFWPTMAATPWWVSLIVGPATLVSDFWTCCANASLVGGSDPRGSDGSHPEVHGEGLSSCLVWEVRDEGQTCRNQQVWCKSRSS